MNLFASISVGFCVSFLVGVSVHMLSNNVTASIFLGMAAFTVAFFLLLGVLYILESLKEGK